MSNGWVGTTFVGASEQPPVGDQLELLAEALRCSENTSKYKECTSAYLGPFDLTTVNRTGTYGIGILTTLPVLATERLQYERERSKREEVL